MTTRREQLRPEVRARTILAACAHARLTPLGDVPSDAGCTGHVGVLLDRSGSAYLVVAPDGREPEGGFRITCRAGVPGLGVLRLEGSCGGAVCLAAQPAVADLLARHRSSWAADEHAHLDAASLRVVTVDVTAVTVLTPATESQRAGVVPVELDAFEAACPDAWLLDAEPARERLEREHQDDLRSLAVAHAGREHDGGTGAPLAVSVRSIGPRHLDLICLSADGVTSVTIPFDGALEHPTLVRRWVARAARRAA